jgi:hypothetical protein
MKKLPSVILESLEATGLAWETKRSRRHVKIYVGGRLAGVVPGTFRETDERGSKNVAAQIRRVAREARASA